MLTALAPVAPAGQSGPIKVRASETTHDVDGRHDFALPPGTTHLAIHWPGQPNVVVKAAFSTDGAAFSEPAEVEMDEVGESRADGETYGAVMTVDDARVVRVTTDGAVAEVSVLALDAAGDVATPLGLGAQAASAGTIPAIIPRSGWGADELLRFDAYGQERFQRTYFPLQKLVVHHTAGRNADPDPAATIRAIYYYHAVTQGWGDIGYQYLIDEAGRVYEGRYSRDYWNGTIPSADNEAGLIVRGSHTRDYNPGSLGIALMGTFTSRSPTPAALASVVRLLTWASATHGIDPSGSVPYVNPLTGATRTTPNIAGHRDYAVTACPGGVLYALLPSIRRDVAAAISSPPAQAFNPQRTLSFAAGEYVGHQFDRNGTIIASKSYTLPRGSTAPTDQKGTIPNQHGNWYSMTAGVWAGYWIAESSGLTLGPPPTRPVVEAYDPSRPLIFAAGTYVGYQFDSNVTIIASKSSTVAQNTIAWTYQHSTIPNLPGKWYSITAGVWAGYWIAESPGISLGLQPPVPPQPIETYDPPRTLWFAPGTYVGRRFTPYGMLAASKPYTLVSSVSAPTRVKSTIRKQKGNWYYVTAGVWEGYWIQESTGTTIGSP